MYSPLISDRRFDLAAVTIDIAVAHVVGHDKDDVRPRGIVDRRRSDGRCRDEKNKGENQTERGASAAHCDLLGVKETVACVKRA